MPATHPEGHAHRQHLEESAVLTPPGGGRGVGVHRVSRRCPPGREREGHWDQRRPEAGTTCLKVALCDTEGGTRSPAFRPPGRAPVSSQDRLETCPVTFYPSPPSCSVLWTSSQACPHVSQVSTSRVELARWDLRTRSQKRPFRKTSGDPVPTDAGELCSTGPLGARAQNLHTPMRLRSPTGVTPPTGLRPPAAPFPVFPPMGAAQTRGPWVHERPACSRPCLADPA